jgi:predicted AAA+ superfamily ATPase
MNFQALAQQNPWWADGSRLSGDQTLQDYAAQVVRWTPRLLDRFLLSKDRVYTLRGPRQVGKTTLLKLVLDRLVREESVDPRAVFYFSCDLLRGPRELSDLVDTYLKWQGPFSLKRRYILLDEVSSVANWAIGVRGLANRGRLRGCTLVLTGSQAIDVGQQVERLPGRRGESAHSPPDDLLDKVMMPMSFAEYVETVQPGMRELFAKHHLHDRPVRLSTLDSLFSGGGSKLWSALLPLSDDLSPAFRDYMLTGGFPRPLNDFKRTGRVSRETYDLYVRVLMGDLARWKHDERTAREILAAVVEKYGNPISWRTLAGETGLASHNTAAKYVSNMERTFTLQTVHQYDLRRKRPAPRKERKVYVSDPFIFHCIRGWSLGLLDSFEAAKQFIADPQSRGPILEAIVADHLARVAFAASPTSIFDAYQRVLFWRSRKGWEADFVIRVGDKPRALQVTASRPKQEDLRALRPFGGGIVLTEEGEGDSIPLPVFLLLA